MAIFYDLSTFLSALFVDKTVNRFSHSSLVYISLSYSTNIFHQQNKHCKALYQRGNEQIDTVGTNPVDRRRKGCTTYCVLTHCGLTVCGAVEFVGCRLSSERNKHGSGKPGVIELVTM